MSMYNDIAWRQEGNEEMCVANSKIVADYARRFAHGHWSFLGLGSEKKWYGTHTYKPNGEWDRVPEDMMLNFGESGRPVFPVLWKEERCEAKGKLSIHFCVDEDTPEVVLCTSISVNQVSIYGAVADICDEPAWRISGCSESTGKLVAHNNSETLVLPTELSTTNKTLRTKDKVQGNLLHDCDRKFATIPDHLQFDQTVLQCWYLEGRCVETAFRDLDDVELDKLVRAHVESTLYLQTRNYPK